MRWKIRLGWVAVANSPNHEQQDWAFGPDQATTEANVLAQCAVLQRADDCRVLAVSTDCVATAGPYANDVQVRCTWWPRTPPASSPPGVSLTGFVAGQ